MVIRIGGVIAAVIALLTLVFLIARRAPSTVHAKRTFKAPVEKVWAAWTDPEVIKQWWGPADFEATVIEPDPRVGGALLFCMKPKAEPNVFCNVGTYEQVEPGQKLVAKLSFSDERGNPIPGRLAPVPGHWPDQVTMTVTFQTLADGRVRVDVFERGIPMIMMIPAKMGWRQQLAKLDKLL